MKSYQYRFIWLFVLLISCLVQLSGADKKHEKRAFSTDGPYLLYTAEHGFRSVSVDTAGFLNDQTYGAVPKNFSFDVYSDKGEKLFPVSLHKIKRPEWKSKQAGKILILSDPHGNWECFSSILKKWNVVDQEYRWTFGKNQLVVIGDVFDRGKDVLPIYWLLYKLEKEAADAGGQLVFLLGNHEGMVLAGDLRYVKSKYLHLADTLHIPYQELWNKQTELGRWLGTRNTMQLIGDNLFVHAGLSLNFLDKNKSIPEVNKIMSEGLFLNKQERKAASDEIAFMYATYGPVWYRGMVHSADRYHPLYPEDLPKVLDKYKAKRLFVGHTIFDDITTFYKYKVVAVNVDNKENMEKKRGRGVLVEDGQMYVIFDSGKKELIREE